MPERSLLPIQDPESLTQMLDLFIEQQLNGPLSQSEAWVRPLESKESFLNPSTAYFEKGGTPFMPFAMKLALPLTTASCFMEISTEIFIPSTPG